MKLYFTRHGETEWNREYRMQGAHNSPLTVQGQMQAQALWPWLKPISLEAAYVSPLMRARETLDIALSGRSVSCMVDERLKEANLGAFEGMTFAEASIQYPEAMGHFRHSPDQFIPIGEGAETFHDLRARIGLFLAEIAVRHTGNVLVVTHALVLLCMRVYMLDIPLSELRKGVHVSSCCRCEAEYCSGTWKILRFGEE